MRIGNKQTLSNEIGTSNLNDPGQPGKVTKGQVWTPTSLNF